MRLLTLLLSTLGFLVVSTSGLQCLECFHERGGATSEECLEAAPTVSRISAVTRGINETIGRPCDMCFTAVSVSGQNGEFELWDVFFPLEPKRSEASLGWIRLSSESAAVKIPLHYYHY